MIRFNVVTPTFNDAHKYLYDAIAAVSCQIYEKNKFEIVHTIVDDGSSCVNSLAFIDNIQVSPFLNVIRQNNLGFPAAKNAAIRSIDSDYILPLDSFDLIHPCLIQEFYNLLEFQGFPKKVLLAPHMTTFGTHIRQVPTRIPTLHSITKVNSLPLSTLFSTQSGINYPYDENMIHGSDDWELWIRLIANHHELINLNLFGFFHRDTSKKFSYRGLKNYHNALSYIRLKHSHLYKQGIIRRIRKNPKITFFDYIQYTYTYLRQKADTLF